MKALRKTWHLQFVIMMLLGQSALAKTSILFRDSYWRAEKVLQQAQKNGLQPMNISSESSMNLPQNLSEAADLFHSLCIDENDFSETKQSQFRGGYDQLQLTCSSNGSSIFRFIFTIASDGQYLEDLQIIELKNRSEPTPVRKSFDLSLNDGGEIILAVGISTLASGLLARAAFPGESDKFKHAIVGNIISMVGALVAFYGLDLSKQEATLFGVGLTVVVAVLKEYYDSRHRDKHSVELNDALATIGGGVIGVIGFRIKIEF